MTENSFVCLVQTLPLSWYGMFIRIFKLLQNIRHFKLMGEGTVYREVRVSYKRVNTSIFTPGWLVYIKI